MNNRELIRGRQNARKILIQALYQWHMNTAEIAELQAQYLSVNNPDKYDTQYFLDLLKAIILEQKDHFIGNWLGRKPSGRTFRSGPFLS